MDARVRFSPIWALAYVALSSGCAAGPPPGGPPPVGTPPQSIPAAASIALPQIQRTLRGVLAQPPASNLLAATPSRKWIYTAQLYGNDAGVYRKNNLKIRFVRDLTVGLSAPQGTVATPDGWWYVANGGHSNVLIYRTKAHGPVGPQAALDDYGQIPANVNVNPSRRLVVVSNVSTTGGGAGSVSVYLNRQAEPSRTLTYGNNALQGIGVAIDRHGNCYWSFNDPIAHAGSIVEFAGCAGSGAVVAHKIGFAGGLTFDQHENLYYADQTRGIFKCEGVKKCKLLASQFGDPVNINFDRRSKELWVADATGYIDAVNSESGHIDSSTPAAGGSSDPPFGIAPAPGE